MFSNCYQIGESLELFNSQDKSLLSKWGFSGKCSKVYDPKLHTYEMVLSVGNLSKMELPKNSKHTNLSLFQGFIVFQLYLFTSKQLTIEIAISDTTNAKRRLIFSTNNLDLAINQLHCRIPIFKFPIGRWVNFSIDILSFVSKCYKSLTFRSVDYISLSMSGKVRYIFTMRTPLKEINNKYELDEEGNIIENNNDDLDYDVDDNNNGIDGKDNSEIHNVYPGAKNVPDKYIFPRFEKAININIDCDKVFSQIYIENENKQLLLNKNELINQKNIFIQDTANASKMDKSLKFKKQDFIKSKRLSWNKTKNNGPIKNINNTRNLSSKRYNLKNINIKTNLQINKFNLNESKGNTFNKIGNLIISQNGNLLNKKSTYNFNRNTVKLNMNNYLNDYYNDINQIKDEKPFKENNNKEKYDLFNKEEYNNLYKKGIGVTSQIKRHINSNKMNIINKDKFNMKEFDEKINSELSSINNDNHENIICTKNFDIE